METSMSGYADTIAAVAAKPKTAAELRAAAQAIADQAAAMEAAEAEAKKGKPFAEMSHDEKLDHLFGIVGSFTHDEVTKLKDIVARFHPV